MAGVATKFATSYAVTLVPCPAGTSNIQFDAISPDGNQIAGSYYEGSGKRTFRYTTSVQPALTDIADWSSPNTIGNDGTITGSVDTATAQAGFIIRGSTTTIYDYATHEVDGWACGVDQNGVAYRSVELDDNTYRAFAEGISGSTPITVDLDSDISITKVSPGGRILGYNTSKFTVYNPKTSTWTQVLTGIANIAPTTISEDGTMSGHHKVGSYYKSFICKNGVVTDFADSTSQYASLDSVNAGNIFVGSDFINVSGSQAYRAFGWTQSSGYINLNTLITEPNFYFARAMGVSDDGKIVGYGFKSGVRYACILTPQ